MATTKHTHSIDATNQSLGRVASEAAKALMGKMHPSYTPNIRSDVKVTITNASKIQVREKKQVQTTFKRYTGYPGGLKSESLQQLVARKGSSGAIYKAVVRMLPKNTLRTNRLKNLTITE